MTTPTSFRCLAVLGLSLGLFLALPGCKPKSADKADKKEKGKDKAKDGKGSSDNTNPNPNPTPEIKTPERIDINTGVGKDAIDFLSAVGGGTAKATQLSGGFVKAIGLPVVFEDDKKQGYSPSSAESWLRAVGAKLTGVGPPSDSSSSQAGDVAVFSGIFTGGKYYLRMVKEGDAWKADWLSLSSVNSSSATVTAGGVPATADALLQGFAAFAIASTICDKDAMPKDQRIAVIAAGLTPELRKAWADPFDGDKSKGYDYSPARLGVKIAEIGNGAESVMTSPAATPRSAWRSRKTAVRRQRTH
ncbi:MAG: hypothetical protein U0792_02430 [Gemmataceae bacterium]